MSRNIIAPDDIIFRSCVPPDFDGRDKNRVRIWYKTWRNCNAMKNYTEKWYNKGYLAFYFQSFVKNIVTWNLKDVFWLLVHLACCLLLFTWVAAPSAWIYRKDWKEFQLANPPGTIRIQTRPAPVDAKDDEVRYFDWCIVNLALLNLTSTQNLEACTAYRTGLLLVYWTQLGLRLSVKDGDKLDIFLVDIKAGLKGNCSPSQYVTLSEIAVM